MARAAFALGGLGSGFADDDTQLSKLAKAAFAHSNQLIIGTWFEYRNLNIFLGFTKSLLIKCFIVLILCTTLD